MSYLLNEPPLVLLPTLACMIGLNEAIVIQQIHYWVVRSENVKDGKKWVYNTYEEWQRQFPWWSIETVKRTFRNLEKNCLLIADNYNKMNIDRTKWYTINYSKLQEISDRVKMTSWSGQNDLMVGSNWPHGSGQNDPTNNQILPDTTTDTTREVSAVADDPPPKYDIDSEPYKLAHYLREQILLRDPQTKVPADTLEALQSWSKDADRMIRLDKRNPAEARELIQWCQKDDFWCSNILSMATFRKQYDKLKRQSKKGGKKYDPTAVDWEAEAAKYLP